VSAGSRNKLIGLARATTVQDDYGHETPTWAPIGQEWAEVRFGTSGERRGAAQEEATVAATFAVLDNARTRDVKSTDRILFDGGTWNINSSVPGLKRGEREITAIREA
jgi:head-tail adaptor